MSGISLGVVILLLLTRGYSGGRLDSFRSCRQYLTSSESNGTDALRCELSFQQSNPDLSSNSWAWWEEDRSALALRARAGKRSVWGFGGTPESSTVIIGTKGSVPAAQVWSRCEYCALEIVNDKSKVDKSDEFDADFPPKQHPFGELRAVLFDHSGDLRRTIASPPHLVLSSTKWSGFFHEQDDQVSARYAVTYRHGDCCGGGNRSSIWRDKIDEGEQVFEGGGDEDIFGRGSNFIDALLGGGDECCNAKTGANQQGIPIHHNGYGEHYDEPQQFGDRCARIVTRPVFVFPVLTWQVGHLLVDVLEPLYHTMVAQYGYVLTSDDQNTMHRRSHHLPPPVLIFEVASIDENAVLLEKLLTSVWETDSPFALLRLFLEPEGSYVLQGPGALDEEALENMTNETGKWPSRGAIFTTDSLRRLVQADGLTCFTDLHLGLDASGSYYFRGYDRHPYFLGPESSPESSQLRETKFTSHHSVRGDCDQATHGDTRCKERRERGPADAGSNTVAYYDPSVAEVRHRYQAFRRWLWGALGLGVPTPTLFASEIYPSSSSEYSASTSVDHVTVVRRQKSRRLANADLLLRRVQRYFQSQLHRDGNSVFSQHGLHNGTDARMHSREAVVREVMLEDMQFSAQADMLVNKTSLLVAQYGTAVHNVLFLRPGSSLLLLMQPRWCDWAWAFASQAVLLDIHVFVYCDEARSHLGSSSSSSGSLLPLTPLRVRWHGMGWAQGPWLTKDSNDQYVDLESLERLLDDFVELRHRQMKAVHNTSTLSKSSTVPRVNSLLTACTAAAYARCDDSHRAAFGWQSGAVWPSPHHGKGSYIRRGNRASAGIGVCSESVGILKSQSRNYDESFGSPRAHIGNLSSFELPNGMLRVRLVPEIVFRSGKHATYYTAHLLPHYLLGKNAQRNQHVVFCSEVLTVEDLYDTSASSSSSFKPEQERPEPLCHEASAFNEFSTLDLHLQSHAPLVLHAWLAKRWHSRSRLQHRGTVTSTRVLKGSDTFFAFNTERHGNFKAAQFGLRSEDFHCDATATLPVIIDGSLKELRLDLGKETALQGAVVTFCQQHSLLGGGLGSGSVASSPRDCARLAAAAADLAAPWAAIRMLGLPPVQASSPSPTEPFVFLHHEKCAGTSLRRYIASAAAQLGLTMHVPCFDPFNASGPLVHLAPGSHPASCMSFDLTPVRPRRRRQELSVIAGHFQWGVWNEPYLHDEQVDEGGKKVDDVEVLNAAFPPSMAAPPQAVAHVAPRILVMLREPVGRTISFYYERIFPSWEGLGYDGPRNMNDLALEDMNLLLAHFKGSAWSRFRDEGLADTACKMLCGANIHKGRTPEQMATKEAEGARYKEQSHRDVSESHLEDEKREDHHYAHHRPLVEVDEVVALRRLKLSVVGLTERWEDTKVVLRFWFPWLAFDDDVRGNTGMGSRVPESPQTLRADLRQAIEGANTCDLAIYAAGVRQFERQMEALKAKAHGGTS